MKAALEQRSGHLVFLFSQQPRMPLRRNFIKFPHAAALAAALPLAALPALLRAPVTLQCTLCSAAGRLRRRCKKATVRRYPLLRALHCAAQRVPASGKARAWVLRHNTDQNAPQRTWIMRKQLFI